MKILMASEPKTSTAEMYLFGIIGDDLQAGAFVKELKELAEDNDVITIHINSGGGNLFDGLAMYGALKDCKAQTIGKIDGLCASMATVLALGMSKVYMCRTAQFMTHKASGYACGSSDDLKTVASMMDNLENAIANVYAAKTGLTSEEAKAQFLQSEDKWFTAKDALSAKLIDGIYENESDTVEVPATMKNQGDIIAFFNSRFPNFKENKMKQFLMSAGQLAFLNLKADSDPAAITSALDSVIENSKKADGYKTALDAANTELTGLKSATTTSRIEASIEKALNIGKKITVEMATTLRKDYAGNPDGLDNLLKAMSPIVSITNNLKEGSEDEAFKGTWNELDKANKLEILKAKNIDLFKAKYKAQFNKDYEGK